MAGMLTDLINHIKNNYDAVLKDLTSNFRGVFVIDGALFSAPYELLSSVGSTNGQPSTSSDGANVEGFSTLNLYYDHSNSSDTSEIKIWVYDGSNWYPVTTVSLDQHKDVLDPFDSEGWKRIYVELTNAPANNITFKLFPHNE